MTTFKSFQKATLLKRWVALHVISHTDFALHAGMASMPASMKIAFYSKGSSSSLVEYTAIATLTLCMRAIQCLQPRYKPMTKKSECLTLSCTSKSIILYYRLFQRHGMRLFSISSHTDAVWYAYAVHATNPRKELMKLHPAAPLKSTNTLDFSEAE